MFFSLIFEYYRIVIQTHSLGNSLNTHEKKNILLDLDGKEIASQIVYDDDDDDSKDHLSMQCSDHGSGVLSLKYHSSGVFFSIPFAYRHATISSPLASL